MRVFNPTAKQKGAIESLLHNLRYCTHESIVYCFKYCDDLGVPMWVQNNIIAASEDKQTRHIQHIDTTIENACNGRTER